MDAAVTHARRSSVLVVDDDDELRESLAETIARAGYQVSQARDGRDALQRLARDEVSPDLVLLDLMMPVIDGWSVLRTLSAARSRIPVIVMSATREPRLPPAIPFLAKPTSREVLLDAIGSRCPPEIVEAPPKVVATLYVRAGCPRSRRAKRLLAAILSEVVAEQVRFQVRDLSAAPPDDHVVMAPSLVVRRPFRMVIPDGPVDTRYLRMLLDLAQVERRRR